MKLKVCGITSYDQLLQLQGLGIDYAGLIFYKKSPRYAGIKLDAHADAIRRTKIRKVGVFVNEDPGVVLTLVKRYGLDAVQLHGEETPEDCAKLRIVVKVIKAFPVKENVLLTEAYDQTCDYFLFDTASSQQGVYGGTGEKFNWEKIMSAGISKPFLLSGGIAPGDTRQLIHFRHPQFYAVDINSRFEISPGNKNMASVLAFWLQLKKMKV